MTNEGLFSTGSGNQPQADSQPCHDDVIAAAKRLSGVAVRTPLMTSAALDSATGGRIFIKPECLQRTGSFKFRGAYNRLAAIPDDQRGGGVVAYSSGNHAQGVALAASLLGMGFAAAGLLPPAVGALVQEGIDVVAVLNALRVSWDQGTLSDYRNRG